MSDAPIRSSLDTGLDQVAALAVGHGFVNANLGLRDNASTGLEGFAHAEAGLHFMDQGEVFGFADGALSSAGPELTAGVGLRLTF